MTWTLPATISRKHVGVGLALSVLIGAALSLAAIDGRSLWIDEFGTWLITQEPSPTAWWTEFVHYPDSDGQLPFYHFYIYVWSSVFGASEPALRAANFPWLVLAFWAILRAALPRQIRWLWIGVLSLHSFTWYYVNEARPYILLICGASFTCCAWTHLAGSPNKKQPTDLREGIAFYCVGCALMLGGSILGALWVASTALTLLWLFRKNLWIVLHTLGLLWWLVLLCSITAVVIVAIAFNSFIHGARAAPLGFSQFGIGYGIIELLGMAGLGPGRNELREGSISVSELAPMLLASGIGMGAVVWSILHVPRRELWPTLAAFILPLLFLAGLGWLLSMRVVGRHFAVLLLPITLGYAYFLHSISGNRMRMAFAVALVLCLVLSTLLIRFSYQHRKDDYARAAALACNGLQKGDVVWWVADPRGATYYGLLPMSALRAKREQRIDNRWTALGCDALHWQGANAALAPPKRVIYSKPDLYDEGQQVNEYMKLHGLRKKEQFSAFSVFGTD